MKHEGATSRDAKARGELDRMAASCTSVVSVPCTVDISPPYAVRYGGIGVVTKIARYAYFGIENVEGDPPLTLGDVRHFIPEKNAYETWLADRQWQLQEGLRRVLEKEKLGRGCRLHAVFEVPFYRGLNVDSTLAIGVAAVLLLSSRAVTSQKLASFSGSSLEKLRLEADYVRLYRLAWRIECLASRYRPEGHGLYGSIGSSSGCSVFWRRSLPVTSPDIEDFLEEDPWTMDPWGYSLEERLHVSLPAGSEPRMGRPDPFASFDAAVLYVGCGTDSKDALDAHRKGFRGKVDSCVQRALERVPAAAKAPPTNDAPDPRARFVLLGAASGAGGRDPSNTIAADSVMDLAVVKSLELFASLRSLVEDGVTQSAQEGLFRCVNQAQDLYRLFDLADDLVNETSDKLRRELVKLTRAGAGVRLMGAGRSGCLLVVGPAGSLSAALPAAIRSLEQDARPPIAVVWASYIDGYPPEGRGIVVEQHSADGVFLSFPSPMTLKVLDWAGGIASSPRLVDRASWRLARHNYDLVIDLVARRVLKGEQAYDGGAQAYGANGHRATPPRLDETGETDALEHEAHVRESRGAAGSWVLSKPPRLFQLFTKLFDDVHAGARSVTKDAAKFTGKPDGLASLTERSETDRLLKELQAKLGDDLVLRTVPRSSKDGESSYVLEARPHPSLHIAVVSPWPVRSESKSDGPSTEPHERGVRKRPSVEPLPKAVARPNSK